MRFAITTWPTRASFIKSHRLLLRSNVALFVLINLRMLIPPRRRATILCVPRSGISKGGSSVYVTSTINILVIEELMSSIHAILNPSSLLKTIITERAKRRFLFTFKEKF